MHNHHQHMMGIAPTFLSMIMARKSSNTMSTAKTGDNYIHLYNITLLAGRNLQPSDTIREFLINETYARHWVLPSQQRL
jgi:hypothetical protein